MEYKELITKVQQVSVETPDTEKIVLCLHNRIQHRQQQRKWIASISFVLVVGAILLLLPYPTREPQPITLAEQVSSQLKTPRTQTPAPLAGYQHSIRNRQIYTFI